MSSDDEIANKLKQRLKNKIFKDLDLLEGKKIIVWQNEVLRKLDLLISATEFSEHHVARHILLPQKFEKGCGLNLEGSTHVIFVIPPQKDSFIILREVLAVKKPGIFHHVRIVSRVSKQLSDMVTSDKDFDRKLSSFEVWPFFWAPTFGDLVLNTFAINPIKIFVDDAFELISLCSSGLTDLGILPQIRYKGRWAAKIVHSLRGNTGKADGFFDELVIIDRELDPLTPFMSQYSFSGILDDMFGIDEKNNTKVPREILDRKAVFESTIEDDVIEIKLTNDVYRDLIHLSLRDAVANIRGLFKELAAIEDAHSQLSSVTDFMKYMPALQKLSQKKEKAGEALHLLTISYCRNAQFEQRTLYELERSILCGEVGPGTVSPLLEMMLVQGSQEAHALKALSLIIIQSLFNGGLQPKVWNEYQRLIVQSFGVEAMKWCVNMEHIGLISDVNKKSSPYNWLSSEIKKLRVTIDPEQEKKAEHYSGYVPVLVRTLEKGIRDGWKGFKTVQLEKNFTVLTGSSIRRALFVVGGLTRSELGCLRSLGFSAVFTTNILHSRDIIQLCKFKE